MVKKRTAKFKLYFVYPKLISNIKTQLTLVAQGTVNGNAQQLRFTHIMYCTLWEECKQTHRSWRERTKALIWYYSPTKKQVNISGQYGKYNSNVFLLHPLDPFPSKMMRCPWILCFDLLPLQYTDLTHEKWWFLVFFISWSSYSFITQGLIAGWPTLEISSPKSAHLGILKVFWDFFWVFSRFPCQLRNFILKDFITDFDNYFQSEYIHPWPLQTLASSQKDFQSRPVQ